MTTVPTPAGDSRAHISENDRQAIRTIKVFISLGFVGEFAFLLIGLILFPDDGTLVWRLVWTLGLCGIGMGAAVGGLSYLISSRFRRGTPAAYIAIGVSGAVFFGVCQTLCWGLDHNVGLNYWGSIENPTLFLVKGYVAACLGGVFGSYFLNSRKGTATLDRMKIYN
ncbi:hypothetical protein [Streptomyces sp. NBC_01455]|uniref:hypothetical protein n=1 Tax=Streptomyces sp. NBC_01455 TaxID=2903874 RepID=UPI002E30241B|nr:hypothetical protein [Streptomyces sp. NBC_01455]